MKQILILAMLITGSAQAWVCSARSVGLFRYYYAEDSVRATARAKALEECQKHHWTCFSTGCSKTVSLSEAKNGAPCRVTVWAETPANDQCWGDKVMTGYRDGRVWCSRVDVRCD